MNWLNKLLVVVGFFLIGVSVVLAAPVSLEFKNATVLEISNVLLKEILKRDFVMSPEILMSDKRVTVSVREIDADRMIPLLQGILRTVDVQVEDRDGILYVERLQVFPAQSSGQDRRSGLGPVGATGKESAFPSSLRGQGEVKVPDEIESYQPRGRSLEFLAAVARAAGAIVVEHKGKSACLVYSGTKEAVEKARRIIAEVDLPPSSVHVRAVLVEFMDGNTSTRSLNIALSLLADKIGVAYAAGSILSNGLVWKTGKLDAVLSAIDGDNRFRYVAEPTIRVVDGEVAKFMVGSDQPVRGSVTMDNNGNGQQSIEYKSAGVQIEIEPRILANHVQLRIVQQISSFALTTTSNIDSPTVLKRQAQTTVAVKPGELVVLAGMDEQKESGSSSGLFFLPDWMRGSDSEGTRSQIVLMLEVVPDTLL